VHRVDPQTAPLQGLHREDLNQRECRGPQIIPSQSSHHSRILMHLHPIKILGSHMDTICRSFPVNPRPDGGAPVNRHSKSPIDATRALIGRALVLMTLNPFERVAVSIKLVNMLLRSSSPPASLVFDVFFMRTNFQKTFENAI
jgi:hypothetical protein